MKWESPSSFDAGIKQVILEDTLDEVKKRGVRTRFVQFSAGAKTEVKFIHDYHEEVYLVKGDQLLLCENSLEPIKKYNEGEYFTRKAGTYHGPFSSESGCLLLEIHYY
ncbi:MAG: cupin [Pseudomonadales bacterium]|nr:cupin [Pseudomonadales bacterium]